jgi:hypothetical protein
MYLKQQKRKAQADTYIHWSTLAVPASAAGSNVIIHMALARAKGEPHRRDRV